MLLESASLCRRGKLAAAHCIEVTVEDDLHIPAIPEHQPPLVALLADRHLPTHPTDSSAVLADLLAVASSSGHFHQSRQAGTLFLKREWSILWRIGLRQLSRAYKIEIGIDNSLHIKPVPENQSQIVALFDY